MIFVRVFFWLVVCCSLVCALLTLLWWGEPIPESSYGWSQLLRPFSNIFMSFVIFFLTRLVSRLKRIVEDGGY
jgi:hypothetical protein